MFRRNPSCVQSTPEEEQRDTWRINGELQGAKPSIICTIMNKNAPARLCRRRHVGQQLAVARTARPVVHAAHANTTFSGGVRGRFSYA